MFASKPCIATLWRWMQDGINAPDGSRVRLRYTMIGRRRFIERAAVAEFLAACNAVPVASSSAVPKGAANAALVAMGY